ncbi:translation initiation factor IF-2 [Fusibacter tunisiensis]|uniref:Translation initiation factor IF-2 n=1 Tax=Fusibacter tunisiensis TaxID=1008308 RepID=A0ABS2MMM0_9FIRM|nr:translation initiation factor IF-2 [Fusibacter tunisiensis]MBM7560629.1 translation initiation factor IF-2 [Fusibacter tunisiensis]
MSKTRIHELAKELNVQSKELIESASKLGIEVKNHMSTLEDTEVTKLKSRYTKNNTASTNASPEKKHNKIIYDRTKEVKAEERGRSRAYSAGGQKKDYRKPENQRPDMKPSVQKKNDVRSNDNRKPYDSNKPQGERKPYDKNRPQGERKPYDPNRPQGERKPYDPNRPQGDRKPYDKNKPQGDRKPYDRSKPQGGFNKDKDSGSKPPYKRRDQSGSKKPEKSIDEIIASEIQEKTPSKKKHVKKDKIVMTFDTDKLEKKSKKAKKLLKEELALKEREGKKDFDFGKKTKQKSGKYKEKSEKEKTEKIEEKLTRETIYVPAEMTIGEFADVIHKPSNEIIMKLMGLGIMATLNQDIDFDTAALVALEYDITLAQEEVVEENHVEAFELDFEDEPKDLKKRAPVVTVMGHVDHGKTSLLDAIRNTGVADGEAGGITQHIGASEIMHRNEKIVFLDTPGHEAFTSLRARGAKITDIAILVVAADDGVMPQTIEAIDHSKAAGVPIIVAINKIDKPDANPDRVKQELSDRGVLIEEWGGDVIAVPVSAKTGEGLETLLEMVLLVSEMLELKANPDRLGIGTVIEAKVVKGRGTVCTIILEKGTMSVGEPIVAGVTHGKVKAMYNDKGKRVKTIGPSTSVEIDGLNDIPQAGEKIYVTPDEKIARYIADKQAEDYRMKTLNKNTSVTLEELFSKIQEGVIKDLNIIVKADVHGSVEAIKQSLLKLTNDEVRVNIIHANVGAISESDVTLASASNAIIIGFNVRPSTNVTSVAEQEGVDIRTYRIIYDAINDVETAMKGMLDPEFKEVVLGRIQVRATFKIPGGVIAGGYVTSGKVARNANVRVIRDGIVIHDGKISSLKRFKDDAKEVAQGYECGIGIDRFNDIKENDEIEAYINEEVKRV